MGWGIFRRHPKPQNIRAAKQKPAHLRKRWFFAVVREVELPEEFTLTKVEPLDAKKRERRLRDIEALKNPYHT